MVTGGSPYDTSIISLLFNTDYITLQTSVIKQAVKVANWPWAFVNWDRSKGKRDKETTLLVQKWIHTDRSNHVCTFRPL